jgi:hypothetical protein
MTNPTAESFATYRIADILDFIVEAVDAARVSAAGNQRWLNAIDAGYDDLLQADTIAFDVATHAIRIESASEPGKFYTANGDCQCEAFARGIPCRHRAAARIVRRALELRATRAAKLGQRITPAQLATAVAGVSAAYRSIRQGAPVLTEPLGFVPGATAEEREARYQEALREANELFPA